jgi:hypothetical protein
MPPATDDLLRAPLACLFFHLLGRMDRPLETAADPQVALALAAETRRHLDPWTGELQDNIRATLAAGPASADLMDAVVRDEQAAWWWSSAVGSVQIWLGSSSDRHPSVTPPRRKNPRWEAYAQRPTDWFVTSTLHADGSSGLQMALAYQVGDWQPEYPLYRRRMGVTDSARIWELNAAGDWHELVARYPGELGEQGPLGASRSPDWVAVGRHWDGVHLTLGGLLAATYVRRGAGAGATVLWSWDTEQTLWLGDAFTDVRSVSALDAAPTPSRIIDERWLPSGFHLGGTPLSS